MRNPNLFKVVAGVLGALALLFGIFVLPATCRLQASPLSAWSPPGVGSVAASLAPASPTEGGQPFRLAVDLELDANFAPPALVSIVWLDATGKVLSELRGRVPLEFVLDSDPRTDRFGNDLRARRHPAATQTARQLRLNDGTLDLLLSAPAGAKSYRVEALSSGMVVTGSVPQPAAQPWPRLSAGERHAEGSPSYLEGERALATSDLAVASETFRDPELSPYDTDHLLLNAVGGREWKTAGQSLTWQFTTAVAGPQEIWLHSRITGKVNGASFRLARLDGRPVTTDGVVRLPAVPSWTSAPLLDSTGQPLAFELEPGTHTLELTVTLAPLAGVLAKVDTVLATTRDLGLQLRALTGDTQDQLRDWKLDDYLPGAGELLVAWADELQAAGKELSAAVGTAGETREGVNLRIASDRLRQLALERDQLPYRRSWLSEGSGSVSGMLAATRALLEDQALDLDLITVAPVGYLANSPRSVNWLERWSDGVRRFWLSFAPAEYNRRDTASAALSVWVNRPRAQAELIQQMADEEVPELGVRISLIPDEGKIILANAAGRVPDVGLGLSNWLPFELALRGALTDLRGKPGFSKLASEFMPGSFLPLVLREGVYAFPETQDFWLTFYRKDILGKLGVHPPDTWKDLVNLVPTLRRNGLQVYLPIAGGAGFKSFPQTLPFVNQAGGRLYKPDGSGTDLGSEEALAGLRFLAEMFTLYSLPMQVPVFFEHFKDGSLPLGIANATSYVQLLWSAPELNGSWDLAPQPGIADASGNVQRWAPGSGATAVIFSGSKHPDAAWKFLQWWLSGDTQARYSQRVLSTYGLSNLWFPANLKAFEKTPIPASHKAAILAQWKWLREAPKMPGTYMVERQMSDAWNKMVFNGTNPREAVDQAALAADREILRKLAEFGYAADGKLTKPWPVPDIDTIQTLLGTSP